jgi:transcriptional regulator with XRE-family HTH domain
MRNHRHYRLVEALIEARKRAGIGQIELAKRLKRSQTWIARLERGKRRIGVIELIEIAEALGFNPEAIIARLRRTR